MSTIRVKLDTVYEAVQSTAADAHEVVLRWIQRSNPRATADMVDIEQLAANHVWLLDDGDTTMVVTPGKFAENFTEVDEVAAFAAELDKEPTAVVADDPEERKTAQQQMDAYLTEKIGAMMGEFDDLLGMAQDEEDSDAQQGVEWAKERFMTVFGAKEQ